MTRTRYYIFLIFLLLFQVPKAFAQADKDSLRIYYQHYDSVFDYIIQHRFNSFKNAYEELSHFDSFYTQRRDSSLYLKSLYAKTVYFELVASYATAREYAMKYMADAPKYRDLSREYIAQRLIARIEKKEGNLTDAQHTISKALQSSREHNDSFFTWYLTLEQAEIYREAKKYDEAIGILNTYLKPVSTSKDKRIREHKLLPRYYLSLSLAHAGRGELPRAVLYAFEAYKLDAGNVKDGVSALICATLSELYTQQGKFYLGQSYLRESLHIADSTFLPEYYRVPYETASRIYAARTDFENAVFYLNKGFHIYDSVNVQLQSLLLKDMDAKLTINRKNEELRTQIGINKAQQKFRNFSIAFIIILSLTIFVLLLIYNRNRLLKLSLERNNNLITAQKNDLEELNKLKDRLFSIVAHDLRGPVSSLRSLLELLSQDMISQEEFKELSVKLYSRTEMTYSMLENLLNWSRIQMKSFDLNLVNAPLNDIIEECCRMLGDDAQRKNITLERTLEKDVRIDTEPEMLKAIIRNLLNNAIKFTDDGKKVSIRTFKTASEITLEIADQGVGIAEKNIGKLFKIDQSFTTLGTKNEKGSGLGLLISYEFIKKLNGDITVSSEVGKGTVFTITFPVIS